MARSLQTILEEALRDLMCKKTELVGATISICAASAPSIVIWDEPSELMAIAPCKFAISIGSEDSDWSR